MKKVYKFIGAMALSALMAGCYETGTNEGSNNIVISGSLLKGALNNADIKVYDSQNRVIWQGSSDSQGDYSADLASNQSNLFVVEAKAVQGGSMVCDALECTAPLSGNSYAFGETIDASELGALVIRNVFYLADAVNPTVDRNIVNQINGLSDITYQVIKPQLSTDTSQVNFRNISRSGSSIVMAALGFENTQGINLTQIQLNNLNDANVINVGANIQTALALFNGGFAANVELPNLFANALTDYMLNQDDVAAKNTLMSLQPQFAEQALLLANFPGVGLSNQNVIADIEQSIEQGINFATLNQTIDEYTVELSNAIDAVSASSTHWSGEQQARSGQWQWVSEQGSSDEQGNSDEQWLQLHYSDAVNPSQLAFGIDANINLEQAKLQALDGNNQWQQLALLNPLTSTMTDERQVKHGLVRLDLNQSYQNFRLLFPSNESSNDSIRLEYACLKTTISDFGCGSALPALSYQTSSSKLNPNFATNPQNGKWWISQMATNQPQWLAISYQQSLIASSAYIVVKQSNQGQDVVLQGSNNGQDWQDITSITDGPYPVDFVDSRNFRHIEVPFGNTPSFRHYRYHSSATSFVWLEYLSFKQ